MNSQEQVLMDGREKIVEAGVQRIRAMVIKIDSRLEVRRGAPLGDGKVLFEGKRVMAANRTDRAYVCSGENIVASFPADEIFTEQEVREEVEKGLHGLVGKKPIQL